MHNWHMAIVRARVRSAALFVHVLLVGSWVASWALCARSMPMQGIEVKPQGQESTGTSGIGSRGARSAMRTREDAAANSTNPK